MRQWLCFAFASMAFSAKCLGDETVPAPDTPVASIVVTARGVEIEDGGEIPFGTMLKVSAKGAVYGNGKTSLKWEIEPKSKLQIDEVEGLPWLQYITVPSEDVTITIKQSVVLNNEQTSKKLTVICGKGSLPPPVVVVPPGPIVIPPKPIPDNPPNPNAGVRALMLFGPSENSTAQQINAIDSPKAIAIYNAKCMKDSVGRPAWRKWDVATKINTVPAEWSKLFESATDEITKKQLKVPVLCIERGDRLMLYEITNEASVLAALNQTFGS